MGFKINKKKVFCGDFYQIFLMVYKIWILFFY